jgi:hypothetical protein
MALPYSKDTIEDFIAIEAEKSCARKGDIKVVWVIDQHKHDGGEKASKRKREQNPIQHH